MTLHKTPTSSSAQRRARTHSLIQLGGLLEHAGTLDVFSIPLGVDLQKDPSVKNNIAALFKSLLIINDMVTSGELDLNVLTLQGLQAFKDKGLSASRPLDRKKYKEFEAYSESALFNKLVSKEFGSNEFANNNANQNKLLEPSKNQ
jgi:hypothetical protein